MTRVGVSSLQKLALTVMALLLTTPAWAQDKVSLQLKWLHQFQFAGYYAALQQGFYRDAGLDVEIREGGPNVDVMKAVQDGNAEFGVCTTSVLLQKPRDPQITVLGAIFQHSPAVILVPSRARIGTLAELKGHPLMDAPGSDDLAAMLKHERVDYAALPRVQHNGDPHDLVSGKADAMVAYSTNEPFILGQLGVPYRMFSPRAYGFDFYGDNLCTSAAQAHAHPERTRAFLAASLKGWNYALTNKDEVVQLILNRYSKQKSADALLFEAVQSENLIEPGLIPLGTQTIERWQSIANAYASLGMLQQSRVPDGLIYRTNESPLSAASWWVMYGLVPLALGLVLLGLLYTWIKRQLARKPIKPKLSAIMAGLFVCLSIPVLVFILLYNYYRNSEAIVTTLQEEVVKTRQASIDNVQSMIKGVAGILGLLGEAVAANPEFLKTEESRELLFRALTSAEEIDAAFVSFRGRLPPGGDANR